MKNVLVFPCGSEIGLEIHRSLSDSIHFCLFGASSVNDHGKYVYKNYIADMPFADSHDFIDTLNSVVSRFDIDYIMPAHDSALLAMAANREAINAVVVTSCLETCQICRSKKKTYEVLEGMVPTPRMYSSADDMEYPVFLKPDVGQGAKGTYLANTKEEVGFYLKKDSSLLALEYLPGDEYTIDCFTDRNRKLLFSAGRKRARISGGISVNAKPVRDERFRELAEIINKHLDIQGAWFYQVKERANGDLVLLEIAPRIAGTMALFRAAGVNFAQLSLFDRMGKDVGILFNDLEMEIDRALFARFSIEYDYDVVYIDLDDTIIVNGMVNTNIMRFLYQARNNGKDIVILSRHRKDITNTLREFAISELLFREIVVLNDSEKKSDHMTSSRSIFIDDSFSERRQVAEALHIPVFSLDAVESLMSWKG